MNVRILVVLICCLWGCTSVYGQYVPNQGQRFQMLPMFNPAFSGVEPFGDFKMSYRHQWAGFGSQAPRFLNLSYNTRLVHPLDLSYNALRPSSPDMLAEGQIPAARRMIHGIGGQLFHTQVGVIKSVGTSVNYSVHYPLGGKTRMVGGVSVLFENRKLDVGEVTVRDPDPYYDYLLTASTSQNELNVRAGVLVYGPRFYIGVSYLPVVHRALNSGELDMTQSFYRASAQAGWVLPVDADVTVKPSLLALVQTDNKVAIDYSVKGYFRQNIWLGLTYRDIKSGIAIIGWNFDHRLSASYAYEMSLGPFRQFNDGSHELVISLRVNNFRKYPQYTW